MTGKRYENLIPSGQEDNSATSEYLHCKNQFLLIRVNSMFVLDPLFSDAGRHNRID